MKALAGQVKINTDSTDNSVIWYINPAGVFFFFRFFDSISVHIVA